MKIKFINSYSCYRKGVLLFIMRLYVFLFISTMFALTPTNVVSQNSVITISENQSLSVDEVFQLIKKQTDYKFFYEKGLFDDFAEIDVEKGVITANELLHKSLDQGNLVFTVSDNHNCNFLRYKTKVRNYYRRLIPNHINGKIPKKNLREFH